MDEKLKRAIAYNRAVALGERTTVALSPDGILASISEIEAYYAEKRLAKRWLRGHDPDWPKLLRQHPLWVLA